MAIRLKTSRASNGKAVVGIGQIEGQRGKNGRDSRIEIGYCARKRYGHFNKRLKAKTKHEYLSSIANEGKNLYLGILNILAGNEGQYFKRTLFAFASSLAL
jgi:hypothetical protein